MKMKKNIVIYMPVLHAGYISFFNKHKDIDTLYVLDQELINEFAYFEKEIRAIAPSDAVNSVKSLNIFKHIFVADFY